MDENRGVLQVVIEVNDLLHPEERVDYVVVGHFFGIGGGIGGGPLWYPCRANGGVKCDEEEPVSRFRRRHAVRAMTKPLVGFFKVHAAERGRDRGAGLMLCAHLFQTG